MKIELLHWTPLWVCAKAIRKCWASEGKSDTLHQTYDNPEGEIVDMYMIGDKDKALIERIGNKNKHSSTLEHLNYTFDIDGISRACLQELARHRHASLSVKSTRYTLKELKNSETFLNVDKTIREDSEALNFLIDSGDVDINDANIRQLEELAMCMNRTPTTIGNDQLKYMLPEAYKTSLVWTINARSLQNFLSLRTSNSALWEIRELAYAIYDNLPDEHKYLFKEYINDKR